MKKILLGTTGLIGAALLATAANAETPKVTLGGFSDFQAGYTSDDNDDNLSKTAFRNDNEVTVKVDGKTSGGLGYGAEIDLEADATDDADNQGLNASRTFTYLEGAWGRVELGSTKSAAATQRVDASSVAVATGGINGAWTYFVNGTNTDGFISTSKLVSEHGDVTAFGDESTYNATKINYYTPKFAGFQGGVSYTPNNGARGQTILRGGNTAVGGEAGVSDVIAGALSYENQFAGGIKFAAAVTGEFGNADAATNVEDTEAYNVGALVGYKGFSLAGSYGDWSDSDNAAGLDSDYFTVGLGYEAGPVGVSATYLDSSRDVVGGSNDFKNIVLGADYKLAPGLTPYAEVSFFEFEGATFNNDGTTVILGTQVAF